MCNVFSQLVFLHVYSYMLSLHLFFGRPLLFLPETCAISHRCGCVLASSSGQTTLVFCFPGKFQHVLRGFLMSSFLMWSNMVFPLAHLNILISAEFSLFSSFFFTAQHSETYVIAGLMTLSFNSTVIFLSDITPNTSFHFIHPNSIILLTSACEPPSLENSDPMYLMMSLWAVQHQQYLLWFLYHLWGSASI